MEIKLTIPDRRVCPWEIQSFKVSELEASLHNKQESRGLHRYIVPGVEYKRLIRYDGIAKPKTIMSNTPTEVLDHLAFIEKAKVKVLIFGLELGMVVQALIEKESVTLLRRLK
jgi:hypothetical protein